MITVSQLNVRKVQDAVLSYADTYVCLNAENYAQKFSPDELQSLEAGEKMQMYIDTIEVMPETFVSFGTTVTSWQGNTIADMGEVQYRADIISDEKDFIPGNYPPFSEPEIASSYLVVILAFLLEKGEIAFASKENRGEIRLYDCDLEHYRQYLQAKYPDIFFPSFENWKQSRTRLGDDGGCLIKDLSGFFYERSIFIRNMIKITE
ncbi:hypothetical protein FWF89_03335 [Candidatus Saccharibacteria bacterium]|nr:hypothetical protein [Candidatus Saccharibacteria bacterium]